MVIKFHDREKELHFIEDAYEKRSIKSIMMVLYGRRRVGKTTLIKKFIDGRKFLYLFVEPKSEKELLTELEDSLTNMLGIRPRLDNWDDLLRLIFTDIKNCIIVFDEFQNFLQIDPEFYSKLQKYWDEYHLTSQIFLITIGSYVGIMKKIFTDKKEPLFGRADFLFNLKPFNFFETHRFIDRSVEETCEIYAIFGGVPKYLLYTMLYFEKTMSLIDKLFIDEPAPLMEEGKNILIMEFGSAHKGYFSILEAVAQGKTVQHEIVTHTGLNKDTVGKYLYELVHAYGILKRNYPVTAKKKSPRQSRYMISDNFYRFWFRFIYKNQSILISNPDAFKALIARDINTYYGFVFEDIAREFLIELNKQQNRLPFSFLHIDKWWHREEEIDLIAFDEGNNILFCEVKWKNLSMQGSIHILDELKRKAKSVNWKNSGRVEHFAIIAKNIKGKSEIQKKGYLAFDLDDFKEICEK